MFELLVMNSMSIKENVQWTGIRHQKYIGYGLGVKTK